MASSKNVKIKSSIIRVAAKAVAKVAAQAEGPAEVTITVTKFKDVLATAASKTSRDTDYVMSMSKEHPGVYLKGDILFVKPPGATIRFTITSLPGDKESYFPVGIAFVREGEKSTSDEQRLGILNFPQSETRMEVRSLSITDSYKDAVPGIRYKFSVIVQRGSDGLIGIIDPGIEHEDEE